MKLLTPDYKIIFRNSLYPSDLSKYCLFNSIPTNFLFKLIQAIAVEPEPIQLSKTTSFSLEYVFIKYSIISVGFCVGCHFSGLSLLITGNFCTERGYLSVVVPSLPSCVET